MKPLPMIPREMDFTAANRSRQLGWMLAHAIEQRSAWFVGVLKQFRHYAIEEGWFDCAAYVRGFLDVITEYGNRPRK